VERSAEAISGINTTKKRKNAEIYITSPAGTVVLTQQNFVA
jgi:hypothetical protein